MSSQYAVEGDHILQGERKVPIRDRVDVAVAGGGPAGFAAAISAARNGAQTMLIERDGYLGGMATSGLMCDFMAVDRNITTGVILEVIDRLITTNDVIEGFFTAYDPEILKYVLLEMAKEARIKLLFHSWIVDAIMQGSKIKGLVMESKSGREAVLADIVIDATGDGDVAAFADAEFNIGRKEDNLLQPMSLEFRVGNVGIHKVTKYIKENPDQFSSKRYDTGIDLDRTPPLLWATGFFDLIKKAREKGELNIDHDNMWIIALPRQGEFLVNITRVIGLNGTNAEDLTEAEIETRKQVPLAVDFLVKYVPGFEKSYLINTGDNVGVRETRRIVGEYILTKEDLMKDRKFGDVIGRNFCPLDIHGPPGDLSGNAWIVLKKGTSYDIPYQCLVPKVIENLVVAGRCISTTSEAHASTRSMPSCMQTGQAAGAAAAIAVEESLSPRNVPIRKLQERLRQQGVRLK